MSFLAIIIRLAYAAVFYFLPDLFIHSAIKKVFEKNRKRALRIYWFVNITLFILASFTLFFNRISGPDLSRFNLYLFGVFVSFLFSKLIVGIFLFGEDMIRFPVSAVRYFKRRSAKQKPGSQQTSRFLISRRKFISQSSLLLGAIPFAGFMYGIFKGRFNYTVHTQTLYFDHLPDAFNGITITQLSDIHIGSFDRSSRNHFQELVNIVQSLRSDIIFFTGDIVNSRANEMEGWYDVLGQLSAPLGKFSVLGNHDYGDYVNWKTEEARKENLEHVKNIHPQIGFQLLLNEHTFIEKNDQKLFIAGVENWGKGDFPKFGDIKKATEGLNPSDFKILLSHDPSHWDAQVLKEIHPPQLTLSGHTHGFQMGIEVPAFRFSPSQWVYEQWAGLYQKGENYLYVNRGIGTVGYPGRLGIWPEVTQLILKRK